MVKVALIYNDKDGSVIFHFSWISIIYLGWVKISLISISKKWKTIFHCLYVLGNRKLVKFMCERKDLGVILFRGEDADWISTWSFFCGLISDKILQQRKIKVIMHFLLNARLGLLRWALFLDGNKYFGWEKVWKYYF